MSSRPVAAAAAIIALAALAACQKKEPEPPAPAKAAADAASAAAVAPTMAAASAASEPAAAPAAAAQPNPDRNAYFGETHMHTSWSVDAWVMGNRITGPADAYKYAQGETIKHPMGFDIKIDTPLDFMGVTDHSEYVGVTKEANTPGSYVSKLPAAQPMIMKDPNSQEEQNRVFSYLLKLDCGRAGEGADGPEDHVHRVEGKRQDRRREEQSRQVHRVLLLRVDLDARTTATCTATSSSGPAPMCRTIPSARSTPSAPPTCGTGWTRSARRATSCSPSRTTPTSATAGCTRSTSTTPPGGRSTPPGRPRATATSAWSRSSRARGSRKPTRCCRPTTSSPTTSCIQAILGLPANVGRIDHITGSFVRQAYKDGITMQDTRGYNPYKFGMAGGSDSHNTGSPYRQDNFFGLHADADGTVERRFAGVLIGGTMDVRLENPGGLTGVWAEENTRASLWDAMYRKETFGVSGPHIKVRFFGGWGYDKDIVDASDWVKQSYAGGVPMGADLPPMPAGGKGTAPTFVVWAVKDPTSANLDRIQIIKGWTQNGQSFEKIYDVAWSGDRKPDKWSGRVPAIQSTVDFEKATYTNSVGSVELKTVWTDPEFDASLHAFYYVRVLEIPTPRWTLIQAVKAGLPPPDVVPLTGQERAWTSPIWYTPSAEARKNAPAGTTVADLKKKGANALSDAQLKALIVGKANWLRNNVTGEQFCQRFTAEGQTTMFRIGTNAVVPSGFGNVERDGYQGTTTPYRIEGGKLVISCRRTRTRSHSTSSATPTTPRAATSSATPTTRSFRHRRSPSIR